MNHPEEFAYLVIYSEGYSSHVVGVFTGKNAEERAREVGKGKDWYGGDCAVEKHTLNGPVEYGKSSRVPFEKKKKKT